MRSPLGKGITLSSGSEHWALLNVAYHGTAFTRRPSPITRLSHIYPWSPEHFVSATSRLGPISRFSPSPDFSVLLHISSRFQIHSRWANFFLCRCAHNIKLRHRLRGHGSRAIIEHPCPKMVFIGESLLVSTLYGARDYKKHPNSVTRNWVSE